MKPSSVCKGVFCGESSERRKLACGAVFALFASVLRFEKPVGAKKDCISLRNFARLAAVFLIPRIEITGTVFREAIRGKKEKPSEPGWSITQLYQILTCSKRVEHG